MTANDNILAAIRERRSCKSFTDEEVSRETLSLVIEAGTWAPSGQNLQPCRFFAVTSVELLAEVEREMFALGEKLKKIRPIAAVFAPQLRGEKGKRVLKSVREDAFHGARALIVIASDRRSSSTYAKDGPMAAENMMLAAHALGIGSCYVGWCAATLNRSARLREKVGIPPGFEVTDGVVFGYPRDERKAPPRPEVKDVTTWRE